MEYQLLITTCPDTETAQQLAGVLVGQHLAACVSRIPAIHSTYEWKGETVSEQEVMLFIKSRSDCYGELEKTILEHHPYELPEIIAVPIKGGLGPYLAWIDSQLEKRE